MERAVRVDDRADDELKQLIKQSGIKQPLLVLEDGTILNGWHRYQIAKELGLSRIPVVVLSAPVQVVQLDTLKDPWI